MPSKPLVEDVPQPDDAIEHRAPVGGRSLLAQTIGQETARQLPARAA
jgi:hypothetical protein